MSKIDFKTLVYDMKGQVVDRPNKASSGTLSGHAAVNHLKNAFIRN